MNTIPSRLMPDALSIAACSAAELSAVVTGASTYMAFGSSRRVVITDAEKAAGHKHTLTATRTAFFMGLPTGALLAELRNPAYRNHRARLSQQPARVLTSTHPAPQQG